MKEQHTLTSQMLKELAGKLSAGDAGADILGIAPIERFAEAPERMHPKNIFPDCKSVITIVHLLQLQPSQHPFPSQSDL